MVVASESHLTVAVTEKVSGRQVGSEGLESLSEEDLRREISSILIGAYDRTFQCMKPPIISRTFPCMEANYPCAIKNQRGAGGYFAFQSLK